MGDNLKIESISEVIKKEPFVDSFFLYLSTTTNLDNLNFEMLRTNLKIWNIQFLDNYEAFFSAVEKIEDKTFFAITIKTRSIPPLTSEERTELIKTVFEGFSMFYKENVKNLQS